MVQFFVTFRRTNLVIRDLASALLTPEERNTRKQNKSKQPNVVVPRSPPTVHGPQHLRVEPETKNERRMASIGSSFGPLRASAPTGALRRRRRRGEGCGEAEVRDD